MESRRLIDVLPWLLSIRAALTVIDPLAVVVAGILVLGTDSPWALAGGAAAAFLVGRSADLHRSRLVLYVLEDMPKLALAAAIATLAMVGLDQGQGDTGSHAIQAATCLLVSFCLLVLLRTGVYALTHTLRRKGLVAHPVIIVGAGSVGRELASALLARREHGLVPVGMIDCDAELTSRTLPVPLLGGIDDLDRAMVDLSVNDVIFAFPGPPDRVTIDAVRRSVRSDHQVFVVPRFFELMDNDHHRRTEVIRGIAVMRLRRWGLRVAPVLLKRILDVSLSGVALALVSPMLGAIALAVRLETGPGVIFRQTRVGKDGQNFTLLKFRTLKPTTSDEGDTTWNIDHDDRLGPVGRFLRRTGLDELPQLVNIIRGDMSLVGPRPERPHFVREFSADRERYDDRHRVPSGLTGWAQVSDLRGDTSIDDRVRFDNYYIENWSFWSDIKILCRTIPTLARSEPPRPDLISVLAAAGPAPGGRTERVPSPS